jgi:hypothetical protein
MKKGYVGLLIILLIVFLLFLLAILGYVYRDRLFHGDNKDSDSSRSNCQNIDISAWQTYDNNYKIKYPADWFYKEAAPEAAASQWVNAFGKLNQTAIVWVGTTAYTLAEFKNDLVTQTPGFNINGDEIINIDGRPGTKLSVQEKTTSYPSYIYYVPFFNISYIFQGPAGSDQFSFCEPEIYLKMVDSFKFPALPGMEANDPNASGMQTYVDTTCNFSFKYLSDWTITENYYYETAGGEKATTPTIILKNKANTATIDINLRQKFCMEVPGVSKTRDPLYAESQIYIDFMNYLDQGQTCGQVSLTAPDKNGKNSSYQIVAEFPTNSGIKEVFKDFVRSFQKVE